KRTGVSLNSGVKIESANTWVFFLFNGVADVKVNIMGITHREMVHLTDVLKLILRLMGPECEKYYAEEC
ncbi:MAG TPA: hypothetical protein PLY52_04410, partial [Methanothrix sp.]